MNKAALFSLTALIGFACAAPTEGEGGDGDGDGLMYGDGDGQMNTGGLVTGSGGVAGVTGGTTGSGGAPVTGSGGAVGSGGTPVVGSGGAPPAGVTCSGAGFTVSDGYVDNGTTCGYAFTVSWDGATADPPCAGGVCFEGAGTELCATGNIPATADPMYPGMGIGFNAKQGSDGAAEQVWTTTGTGVTVNYTATGATGPVRVVLVNGTTGYCAAATPGAMIPWASFNTACWDDSGSAFSAGMPITSIQLQVNSDVAAQPSVNVCLTDLTIN